jgi:integrase
MGAKLEPILDKNGERRHPGIYRRGSRYVIQWQHRGKQHKEAFRTLAEAKEAKGLRDGGERRKASRVGFEDYYTGWIETYAGRTARGFSETTRPEYRRPIEAEALPRWRTWKLADVEPGDVRDLFGAMRRAGRSTSAIKKLRAALSAMFATAVEDGKIRTNPMVGVRIPAALEPTTITEEKAKAITRADLAILLAAIPEDWKLFFEFLTHSGLRISEAIGLNWEHLDLGERPKIMVREQVYEGVRKSLKTTSSERDVPLSPGMASRLLAHRRDHYRGEDKPVFSTSVGTELRPANVYRRVLAPAAISVGMFIEVPITDKDGEPTGRTRKRSTVSFHTFRHTCASMLFEAGRDVKQVQEWLGHSDPVFTLRTYVHLMDDGVGDASFFDAAVRAATAAGPSSLSAAL